MTEAIIESIVRSSYTKEQIHSIDININEFNNQIDDLRVTFTEDYNPNYNGVGEILEKIDNYTVDDGYGDLTEAGIQMTTYNEEDHIGGSILFIFNIDS